MDWSESAHCLGTDSDLFFPVGNSGRVAAVGSGHPVPHAAWTGGRLPTVRRVRRTTRRNVRGRYQTGQNANRAHGPAQVAFTTHPTRAVLLMSRPDQGGSLFPPRS